MKRLLILLILGVTIIGCRKDNNNNNNRTSPAPKVTNAGYDGKLLFVDKPTDFQIQTDVSSDFSSTNPNIEITSTGLIKRFMSGEVVPITITDKTNSAYKTTIYALAATDVTFVKPFSDYHGEDATDALASYRQGWSTLNKLPTSNETFVIVVRHADADDGIDYSVNHSDAGPANWWKSCDAAQARQLSTIGKQNATDLGKVFRDLNYNITRVYSSEFCRAVSTATLINAGPAIQINAGFNHPSHNVSVRSLFDNLVNLLKVQPVDNKLTLVVAHHPLNRIDRTDYPTFPKVIPFIWTGVYFVKVSANHNLTYEGAVSLSMYKFWRDLRLKK
jgi:phosphohistidine phosphatase SixA